MSSEQSKSSELKSILSAESMYLTTQFQEYVNANLNSLINGIEIHGIKVITLGDHLLFCITRDKENEFSLSYNLIDYAKETKQISKEGQIHELIVRGVIETVNLNKNKLLPRIVYYYDKMSTKVTLFTEFDALFFVEDTFQSTDFIEMNSIKREISKITYNKGDLVIIEVKRSFNCQSLHKFIKNFTSHIFQSYLMDTKTTLKPKKIRIQLFYNYKELTIAKVFSTFCSEYSILYKKELDKNQNKDEIEIGLILLQRFWNECCIVLEKEEKEGVIQNEELDTMIKETNDNMGKREKELNNLKMQLFKLKSKKQNSNYDSYDFYSGEIKQIKLEIAKKKDVIFQSKTIINNANDQKVDINWIQEQKEQFSSKNGSSWVSEYIIFMAMLRQANREFKIYFYAEKETLNYLISELRNNNIREQELLNTLKTLQNSQIKTEQLLMETNQKNDKLIESNAKTEQLLMETNQKNDKLTESNAKTEQLLMETNQKNDKLTESNAKTEQLLKKTIEDFEKSMAKLKDDFDKQSILINQLMNQQTNIQQPSTIITSSTDKQTLLPDTNKEIIQAETDFIYQEPTEDDKDKQALQISQLIETQSNNQQTSTIIISTTDKQTLLPDTNKEIIQAETDFIYQEPTEIMIFKLNIPYICKKQIISKTKTEKVSRSNNTKYIAISNTDKVEKNLIIYSREEDEYKYEKVYQKHFNNIIYAIVGFTNVFILTIDGSSAAIVIFPISLLDKDEIKSTEKTSISSAGKYNTIILNCLNDKLFIVTGSACLGICNTTTNKINEIKVSKGLKKAIILKDEYVVYLDNESVLSLFSVNKNTIIKTFTIEVNFNGFYSNEFNLAFVYLRDIYYVNFKILQETEVSDIFSLKGIKNLKRIQVDFDTRAVYVSNDNYLFIGNPQNRYRKYDLNN